MSDRNQARSLLKMAFKDFKALRAMRDRQSFDDEIFGFHVQQSAEKALKAWIALLGIEYPYTHNIRILLQLLQSAGANVQVIGT
ncbi:MAG: HEPN domain-containing protein [Pseudomonadota bacterium]